MVKAFNCLTSQTTDHLLRSFSPTLSFSCCVGALVLIRSSALFDPMTRRSLTILVLQSPRWWDWAVCCSSSTQVKTSVSLQAWNDQLIYHFDQHSFLKMLTPLTFKISVFLFLQTYPLADGSLLPAPAGQVILSVEITLSKIYYC